MTASYVITSRIELDQWAVEGLKDAYRRLGLDGPHYTENEFLSAVAHDLLHETAAEIKDAFLDGVVYKVAPGPREQLTAAQLEKADALTEAWLDCDNPARVEFMRRMGAWRPGRKPHYFLCLNAPLRQEVTT